jgi:mannan endo-1,4-beta-mannosidase
VISHLYAQELIDKKATRRTKALYSNLKKISEERIMFGHQDDDAYGVTWKAVDGKSDVKDVCGSYPAVHGWDVGKLELGKPDNLDSVGFSNMLRWIRQIYKRGGISTISWHIDNPVSKNSSWDKTPAVKDILPGGPAHNYYTGQLDLLADFFKKCRADFTQIPLIFRPFHEHNGDWFWWGKGNCTEEEYRQLWRFTVNYLKNEKNIHHLIYAFSPDRSRTRMDSLRSLDTLKASLLYAYPGDDYVDLIGLDNYMDVGVGWNRKSPEEQRQDFVTSLRALSQLANEKNKVAALTETGLESVPSPNWFTEVILNPLKEAPDIKIAYVLVWRNANKKHHYAPYAGHASARDFVKFFDDEKTIFEEDLINIYRTNKPILRK